MLTGLKSDMQDPGFLFGVPLIQHPYISPWVIQSSPFGAVLKRTYHLCGDVHKGHVKEPCWFSIGFNLDTVPQVP